MLQGYENQVNQGRLQFLSSSKDEVEVANLLEPLILVFSDATNKQKTGKGDLGKYLDCSEVHTKGKAVWQKLVSCALNSIDEGAKGNSELFKFLEAASQFEDVLYGLERCELSASSP